jgi:hypothetical protein
MGKIISRATKIMAGRGNNICRFRSVKLDWIMLKPFVLSCCMATAATFNPGHLP